MGKHDLSTKRIAKLSGEDAATVQKVTASKSSFSTVGDLSSCRSLQRLDVSQNEIGDLSGVGACSSLLWLNASQNRLTDVEFATGLCNLTVLNVSKNSLATLPRLSPLINLKALILNDNQLTSLPKLSKLSQLNTLVLSRNQLEAVPRLPASLTKLSASSNRLTSIPDLRKCADLIELRLNSNRLTEVTEDLLQNKRLFVVDIGKNDVTSFDGVSVLSRLRSLRNFSLMGNGVCNEEGYSEKLKDMLPQVLIFDGRKRTDRPPKTSAQETAAESTASDATRSGDTPPSASATPTEPGPDTGKHEKPKKKKKLEKTSAAVGESDKPASVGTEGEGTAPSATSPAKKAQADKSTVDGQLTKLIKAHRGVEAPVSNKSPKKRKPPHQSPTAQHDVEGSSDGMASPLTKRRRQRHPGTLSATTADDNERSSSPSPAKKTKTSAVPANIELPMETNPSHLRQGSGSEEESTPVAAGKAAKKSNPDPAFSSTEQPTAEVATPRKGSRKRKHGDTDDTTRGDAGVRDVEEEPVTTTPRKSKKKKRQLQPEEHTETAAAEGEVENNEGQATMDVSSYLEQGQRTRLEHLRTEEEKAVSVLRHPQSGVKAVKLGTGKAAGRKGKQSGAASRSCPTSNAIDPSQLTSDTIFGQGVKSAW